MLIKLRDGGFWHRNRFVLAAFVIPFVMMLAGYASVGVVPFGDIQAPTHDWATQYHPFLLDLRRNLRSGELPMWSWMGGGFNYMAMVAYYLISPWNLLACLVPDGLLPAFTTVSTCARVALAGPAMAVFLRGTYGHDGPVLTLAGCSFACCGFLVGYHWNVIWLDAVSLTPLVVLYESRMLESGRAAPYILSLWASLCMNFYIGFFTCIFALVTFAGFHVMKWDGWNGFRRRFLRIVIASLVAIGMAAVVLLPAYLALRETYAVSGAPPDLSGTNFGLDGGLAGFLSGMCMVAGNALNFTEPTYIYATLPNIFCGTVTLAMYILFLMDKRIGRRQRLFSLGLLAFLFASCVLRVLDYAWHGMHFPNMIPHRFMYLSSFVLVDGAFREAVLPWERDARRTAVLSVAVFCLVAGGVMGMRIEAVSFLAWWVGSAAAVAVALLFYGFSRGEISADGLSKALSLFVLAQCCVACVCGVRTGSDTSRADGGVDPGGAAMERLVEAAYVSTDGEPVDWRMESLRPFHQNTCFAYGFEGVSMFHSMADARASRFFEMLNGSGNPPMNRYTYVDGGPVVDAVMGIRYLYAPEDKCRNRYGLEEVARDSGVVLLENRYRLPMGFMADGALAGWGAEDPPGRWPDRFASQEAFFRAASGVAGKLFIGVDPSVHSYDGVEGSPSGIGEGVYSYSYTRGGKSYCSMFLEYDVPEDGLYFVYADGVGLYGTIITAGGDTSAYLSAYAGVKCVGELDAGEKIIVEAVLYGKDVRLGRDAPADREVCVRVARMDTDVFEAGFDKLSRYGMELLSRTGSGLSGRVEAGEDGLLFLSFPSSPGWTAKVDGKPVEILSVGGMTALRMSAGEHFIEMSYRTPGLAVGAVISVVSACAGAAWCFRRKMPV